MGGAGRYLHWNSSLGSAAIYMERFRGQDDLASLIDQRRRPPTRLADLLLEWFSAELHDQPKFAQLRTFLDDDLRRDLSNLVVYGLIAESLANRRPILKRRPRTLPLGMACTLIERGYVSHEICRCSSTPCKAATMTRLLTFVASC